MIIMEKQINIKKRNHLKKVITGTVAVLGFSLLSKNALADIFLGQTTGKDVRIANDLFVTGDVTISGTLTNGKGYINHGTTAGTTRPSGFVSIEWHGSVEPTNAINGDTWIDTSA